MKDVKKRIRRWRALRERRAELLSEADMLDQTLAELEKEHLKERPLLRAEIEAIRDHLLSGGNICCEDGHAALTKMVGDPLWLEKLNDWAYEHLGCSARDRKWPKVSVYKFWKRFCQGAEGSLLKSVSPLHSKWCVHCPCGETITAEDPPDGLDQLYQAQSNYVDHCMATHDGFPSGFVPPREL